MAAKREAGGHRWDEHGVIGRWAVRYGVVVAAAITVLLWASAFVSIRSAGAHCSASCSA